MADWEEQNEFILRKYEEFRRHFEELRTSCKDSRRNFLAFKRRLNREFRAFRGEMRIALDPMPYYLNPILRRRCPLDPHLEMEIQQAFRTQFAPQIELFEDWETELENCERRLKKLRSNDDRYMRIMRKRGIGPYTPWLAALDGEYLSDISGMVGMCHSIVRQSMKINGDCSEKSPID